MSFILRILPSTVSFDVFNIKEYLPQRKVGSALGQIHTVALCNYYYQTLSLDEFRVCMQSVDVGVLVQ